MTTTNFAAPIQKQRRSFRTLSANGNIKFTKINDMRNVYEITQRGTQEQGDHLWTH